MIPLEMKVVGNGYRQCHKLRTFPNVNHEKANFMVAILHEKANIEQKSIKTRNKILRFCCRYTQDDICIV